jgi:hypothetical protein
MIFGQIILLSRGEITYDSLSGFSAVAALNVVVPPACWTVQRIGSLVVRTKNSEITAFLLMG